METMLCAGECQEETQHNRIYDIKNKIHYYVCSVCGIDTPDWLCAEGKDGCQHDL